MANSHVIDASRIREVDADPQFECFSWTRIQGVPAFRVGLDHIVWREDGTLAGLTTDEHRRVWLIPLSFLGTHNTIASVMVALTRLARRQRACSGADPAEWPAIIAALDA